jgi:hypothetical protein
LQYVLDKIHEPVSGNKDELIDRILSEWESHGKNKYDLFTFLERAVLADICEAYNLDSKGGKDVLIRRIKKDRLLDTDSSALSSIVDDKLLSNKKIFEKISLAAPNSKKDEHTQEIARTHEKQPKGRVNWLKWGNDLCGNNCSNLDS